MKKIKVPIEHCGLNGEYNFKLNYVNVQHSYFSIDRLFAITPDTENRITNKV